MYIEFKAGVCMSDSNKKFAIMRIAKISGRKTVRDALKHNLRQLKNDTVNIDSALSHKNVNHQSYADYDTCKMKFEANLSKIENIRKNAVMLHEIVITASPDQVAKMSYEELISYFNDSMKWANKIHGGSQNLVSMSIHYDESNPHCHLLYTPVCKVGDKFKLNSRSILGNVEKRRHPTEIELEKNVLAIADARLKIDRGDKNIKIPKALVPGKNNVFILQRSESRLSDYQTSFYDDVGKKHGLDRGIKKWLTNATHTPIKEYHSELTKELEELKQELTVSKLELTNVKSKLRNSKETVQKTLTEHFQPLINAMMLLSANMSVEKLRELQIEIDKYDEAKLARQIELPGKVEDDFERALKPFRQR
jgi:hypothetical protein